ncbi:mechanosensitive ion channel family protein [Mucilaginibacter phyllosphaerae]|uniref:Mechanosensitive ion channel family protein n=1 Tax=Mucilaginibacter phyllosphaerae TaxID=1812349 RepID=A0A4Y8AAD0_9SPHI|nr:mechanosensitive ion channel family protein [Mucilaginibacter phyllosphaerae]MBB3970000.1 small-conductance mechanosensitive channel [Mucilaginibacter phyllosphaerae]TEW65368.1 mechanosensitive ion channel family protein [Mucilaginibacter phyllosphaerae]GGH16331.1 mechanosensitive ion channel protein MscS [Mucilaginibacter phyllosphaerae]
MHKTYYLFLFFIFSQVFTQAQQVLKPAGVPIVLRNDTLFKIYAGQGMFAVRERADIITKRLNTILDRLDFIADSVTVKNDTAISVISYKSQMIMVVNNKDATFTELNRPQLAAQYQAVIKKKLGLVFENNSLKQFTINILEAVAVIILVVILIWGINKSFRWLTLRFIKAWESRLDKLAAQGAPVSYAHRIFPFVSNIIKVIRILIILLLVYLALPILFFIFPSSKPIATQLLSYVVDPLKGIAFAFIRYIPNLLTVAVIFAITYYILKLVKFISKEIGQGAFTIKGFYPEWAMPTYNIIRILLYAFMFVAIFPYLPGSDSKVFQGVTVFLGVLFSFGSSSAVSNMISGVVLTYMRPFKIGDRVKLGDITGDVIEKNVLATRLRTIKNEDVVIPNAAILNGHSVNYSSSANTLGLILNTTVTIGYDAPWQKVQQLLIDAALATDGIQQDPKPFVLQTALNDFNVGYQVNAYTNQPNKMAVIYSGLYQNIQDKFNEAGVEIMSPGYTALRDGNSIQIPDAYKPAGYTVPGFNINK